MSRREYLKKWRSENKDKVCIYNDKYNTKNREEIRKKARERAKDLYEKNKEYIRCRNKKNRSKIREQISLIGVFGTSKKVPAACKKMFAIKRALRNGMISKEILSKISKGETHAAYI